MNWIYPNSVIGVTAPVGTIATEAQLAEFIGNIDPRAAGSQLALLVIAGAERVEKALGYSFRQRRFAAEAGKNCRNVAIWLPWGPASQIEVTVAGSVFSDWTAIQLYRHVNAVQVNTSEAFTVSWQVGSQSGFTASVQTAVMQMAAQLWENRMSGEAPIRDAWVQSMLPDFVAKSDWN